MGVGVAVSVEVGEGVIRKGLDVGVRVCVGVGVEVGMGVRVGVGVGEGVCVRVGVAGDDGR